MFLHFKILFSGIIRAFSSSLMCAIIPHNHLTFFKQFFKFCATLPKFLVIFPFFYFFAFIFPFSEKLHAYPFSNRPWIMKCYIFGTTCEIAIFWKSNWQYLKNCSSKKPFKQLFQSQFVVANILVSLDCLNLVIIFNFLGQF